MSGIGGLTAWDKIELRDAIDIALYKVIERHEDIHRIAERFCSNDVGEAIGDIFEKGLTELLALCDLDDKMEE